MNGGFTEIALTRGQVARIDARDFAVLSRSRWQAVLHSDGRRWYAYGTVDRVRTSMHRLLLGAQRGETVDHVNGNGLDNRRCNLRLCTSADNAVNSDRRRTNRYRGVRASGWGGSYTATINVRGQRIHLGTFPTEEAAAMAYDDAAAVEHREFAVLNFPQHPRYLRMPVAGVAR